MGTMKAKEKVTFTISDGTYMDYDSAKQDYLNGIRGETLREKHNMSTNSYKKFLRDLRAEGIVTMKKGGYNRNKPPKYYTKMINHGIPYYVVKRIINKEVIYGGYFHKEEDAIARVKELEANNWDNKLPPQKRRVKHYCRHMDRGRLTWVVKRTIKGVQYCGGYFKTEAEAIARVKELDEIGWESCL